MPQATRSDDARAEVVRASDHLQLSCTTHLGHILKHGDSVVGYDLTTLSFEELEGLPNQRYLPDVVLVRKIYPERRRRIWRLKRMEVEEEGETRPRREDIEQQDFEEFMEELEQDKHLRAKVNLYADPTALREGEAPPPQHLEVVQLGELLSDMNIADKPEQTQGQLQSFMNDLQSMDFKKK